MKNPFEFAQRLYDYLTDKLTDEEKSRTEEELNRAGGATDLLWELQDKQRTGRELGVMVSFDTEAALQRIERMQRKRIRRIFAWSSVAAGIVVALGGWLLWSVGRQAAMTDIPLVADGVVTVLETADGECYALDTLSTLQLSQHHVQVNNEKGILQWLDVSQGNERKSAEYNKVTVPYGGTYSLVLPDGSRFYLNSGTVLEFPSHFAGDERRVKVRGEVYCEVARDENKPFVVEVAGMCVKVLGTVFNVKAYEDEAEVYTTLVSGSVMVETDKKIERRLVPGELAVYSRETEHVVVTDADVYEQTAWKDGVFYFKELPLEKILKIVSRWYNLEVFYANPKMKEVVFNGKMPMYSSVEDILKKFEYADTVRFELKGRTLTVY